MSTSEEELRSLNAIAALAEDDPRRRQLELDGAAITALDWKLREIDAVVPMARCLDEVLAHCPEPLRGRFWALFKAWDLVDQRYDQAVYELAQKASDVPLPPLRGAGR